MSRAINIEATTPGIRRLDSLSLAAPAYNEGDGIEAVVLHWTDYLRNFAGLKDFEIVVCNDGSCDETGAILDRLATQRPELKPVHFARNQGAAAALANAITHTSKDWVLLLDSDGQFPIENLDRMVDAVKQQHARAAIGVRSKQDRVFARFGSWASGRLCNLLHRTSYRDFNSAFKLVHGPLIRSLKLEAKGLNFSTEITSRLLEVGVSLVEVDIEHLHRGTGQSSMRPLRDAGHRMLFVFYIGYRQLLLRLGVLRVPEACR